MSRHFLDFLPSSQVDLRPRSWPSVLAYYACHTGYGGRREKPRTFADGTNAGVSKTRISLVCSLAEFEEFDEVRRTFVPSSPLTIFKSCLGGNFALISILNMRPVHC